MFASISRGVAQYRASEAHVAVMRSMYRPNGTRRGVIYCHGVSQTADDWTNSRASIEALAAAGYPVIACALSAAAYGGANWGNADHISAITDAWTYLKSPFGAKTDKVGILGGSMGAVGALAWARANLASCFAVAAIIPVLDIDDIYQTNPSNLRPGVGTAYAKGVTTIAALSNGIDTSTFIAAAGVLNVASSAAFPSSGTLKVATASTNATVTYTGKTATTFTGCTTTAGGGVMATGGAVWESSLGSLATNSPVAFGASDLAALPVRLWTSSDDSIAATTAEATAWDGRGATKTVTDLGAVGHVGSSTDPQQVVQFFDDAGGRT